MLLTVGCNKGSGYKSCEVRSARLWNQAGERVANFIHDEALLLAAAFSPNGGRIVTAGETGVLRFWLPSGQFLFNVKKGSHWVARTNFSPDGKQFLTGGCHPYVDMGQFSPLPFDLCPHDATVDQRADLKVKLYDHRGKLKATLAGWRGLFSPDGQHLLSVGEACNQQRQCQSQLHLWRPDGTAIRSLTLDVNMIDVHFSPDGQFIVVADKSGTATVHNLDGQIVNRFGGFLSYVTSFSLSPDGNRLAMVSCPNGHQGACLERAIHVWDPNGPLLASRQLARVRAPHAQQPSGRASDAVLRYSPRGSFLFASVNGITQPMVWKLGTEALVSLAGSTGRIHQAWFDAGEMRILTNGDQNKSNSQIENRLQLWDIHGQRLKILSARPREGILAMPVSVSGHLIVAGNHEGIVRFWDWNGNDKGQPKGHQANIEFVDRSPIDEASVTIDHNGVALIWDDQMNPLPGIDAAHLNRSVEGDGWNPYRYDETYKVRFTADGQRILIIGPKNMSLWDRKGQNLWDIDADMRDFTLPRMSRDQVLTVRCIERGRGASIGTLSHCYNSMAMLQDLNDGHVTKLDPGTEDEAYVAKAVFNPQGNRIVTVNEDGTTRLWDIRGNLMTELFLPVKAVDFDPKGGQFATLSGDGIVRLWRLWDDVESMIAEAEHRLEVYTGNGLSRPSE